MLCASRVAGHAAAGVHKADRAGSAMPGDTEVLKRKLKPDVQGERPALSTADIEGLIEARLPPILDITGQPPSACSSRLNLRTMAGLIRALC